MHKREAEMAYVERTDQEIADASVKYLEGRSEQDKGGIFLGGKEYSPRTLAQSIKDKVEPVYLMYIGMARSLGRNSGRDPVALLNEHCQNEQK